MKWKHEFEMLVIKDDKCDDPNFPFHDDYYGEGIEVRDFFGKHIFDDFRLFNGVRLEDMDNILVEISEIFSKIKNKYKPESLGEKT